MFRYRLQAFLFCFVLFFQIHVQISVYLNLAYTVLNLDMVIPARTDRVNRLRCKVKPQVNVLTVHSSSHHMKAHTVRVKTAHQPLRAALSTDNSQ